MQAECTQCTVHTQRTDSFWGTTIVSLEFISIYFLLFPFCSLTTESSINPTIWRMSWNLSVIPKVYSQTQKLQFTEWLWRRPLREFNESNSDRSSQLHWIRELRNVFLFTLWKMRRLNLQLTRGSRRPITKFRHCPHSNESIRINTSLQSANQ